MHRSKPRTSLYERDFHAWLQHTVRALRSGRWELIDRDALAEELEDMGKRDRRAIKSHLRVILIHLLKWATQPEMRSRGWLGSIGNARDAISDILADSPSLAGEIAVLVPEAYLQARRQAAKETGLPAERFPSRCPWTEAVLLEAEIEAMGDLQSQGGRHQSDADPTS
ncbi:MAG: DUF29 domain-containing protein [Nitrococcus sp.]|nr:DUF29 domain-containing protein [Nitrococcus sp.]